MKSNLMYNNSVTQGAIILRHDSVSYTHIGNAECVCK